MTLDLGAEYGTPRQHIYTARFLESIPLRSLLLSAMIFLQTAVTHGTAAIYHIYFIFLFLSFMSHGHVLHIFSVHSDDILNKQFPKTFAKSGILLSVEHFLCYDTYIWRQSCAAGNGGHIAAK